MENLIQRYDALAYWRERVRSWAANVPPCDLIGILYSSLLDAKYALLAVIHDTCFGPEQVPHINPWPDDAPYEVMREGMCYLVLKRTLLPNSNTGTKGLDSSESQRLKVVLDDVARSLPMSGNPERHNEDTGNVAASSSGRGKRFRVALSFPGERRQLVKQVAESLAEKVGRNRVLYDKWYEAEFARLDLDTYLQNLYNKDADLVAVFICAEYDKKEWCGLEWRAIRDLIKRRESWAIMPFRFDDTNIPGLFSGDGYIKINDRDSSSIATLILDRLRINDKNASQRGVSQSEPQSNIETEQVVPTNPRETHENSNVCEDGTNVPRGTSFLVTISVTEHWYKPRESKCCMNWKQRWERLRSRFEEFVDNRRPITCTLVEKRIPGFPEFSDYSNSESFGREWLQSGGGLQLEPSFLYKLDRSPVFGEFPIHDVNGRPMSNSAGEPFGFRFGLSRQFILSVEQAALRETLTMSGPRIPELTADGAALLYQLPSDVAISLWQNWRQGFSRRENAGGYLWLDALFELSRQRGPGDSLYSRPAAWMGNGSIGLIGQGLFPRLPDLSHFPGSIAIPHDNGYPVAWRSTIQDVARASVIAIDELLDRAG
ncbi:MAG: TIR domain-containing protein [Thermoguttaceae bacterium]